MRRDQDAALGIVGDMSRCVLAWFVSVPLVLAGVEGGHWLAYRLVYPSSSLRAQALAHSGHAYLSYAPLFFAVAGAVCLCAFGLRVFARGDRDSVVVQVPLLPFLLVAPLAFAFQECSESLLVGGWPFAAPLAPTFLPGLVFQAPFALLAFLVARWLLRAAERLRTFAAGGVAPSFPSAPRAALSMRLVQLRRLTALAGGHAERGPPRGFVPAPAACR
jgi:hypothetical protein